MSDIQRLFGFEPGCSSTIRRDGCLYFFDAHGDLVDHEPVTDAPAPGQWTPPAWKPAQHAAATDDDLLPF